MTEEASGFDRPAKGSRVVDPLETNRRTLLAIFAGGVLGIRGLVEYATRASEPRDVSVFGYGGVPVLDPATLHATTAVGGGGGGPSHPSRLEFDDRRVATLASGTVRWLSFFAAGGQQPTVTFEQSPESGLTVLVVYDRSGAVENVGFANDRTRTTALRLRRTRGVRRLAVHNLDGETTYSLVVSERQPDAPSAIEPAARIPKRDAMSGDRPYGTGGYGGVTQND